MKLKILFIMTTLNGGGAEKVLMDILNNFDFEKYSVELLLTSNEGIYTNKLPESVKTIFLFRKNSSFIRRFLFSLYRKTGILIGFKILIYKLLFNNQYDSIISFMEGEALLYQSQIINKTKNNIGWVHTDFKENHWTKKYFYKEDEINSYVKLNQIVFVSKSVGEIFNSIYQISAKQHIIYNLIDIKSIRKLALETVIPKNKLTVCSVGRLENEKQTNRLINVAALLKSNHYDVDLWILGDGKLREQLEQQAKDLKVEEMVHFLGFKQPPYCYMNVADIFISTSKAESFSLVVCEAMCLGLPIVSTKTTGPIELLDNNKFGLLTDHDEASIYNALVQLIDSEEKRKHYLVMSLERAKMFDVQQTMNEIYSLLN